MNLEAIRAVWDTYKLMHKSGHYLEMLALTWHVVRYIYRLFRYEFLFVTKCEECGGTMDVFFLRSEYALFEEGDSQDLHDWLICQNDNCMVARQLGGKDDG